MRSLWQRMLFAASGLLSLGCHGDCTTIGCASGLMVHLPSIPAGAYSVEVLLSGPGGPRYFYECAGGAGCLQDIFFDGIQPSHPVIEVKTTAGTRLTEIPNLEYDAKYPNGEHCGPACFTATVTAQLPTS